MTKALQGKNEYAYALQLILIIMEENTKLLWTRIFNRNNSQIKIILMCFIAL